MTLTLTLALALSLALTLIRIGDLVADLFYRPYGLHLNSDDQMKKTRLTLDATGLTHGTARDNCPLWWHNTGSSGLGSGQCPL